MKEGKSKQLLTEEDFEAIKNKNHEYLNSVGADYYGQGEYEKARIYYELASTLGDTNSPTNLGYIYMYGRDVPIDYSVAIAFYQIGAEQGNIDAFYKLGNIYQSGKGVKKDPVLALQYYDEALNRLKKEDPQDPEDYPSLFFTLAREMMPGGLKEKNLGRAYDYLLIAKEGYERQINHFGAGYYKDILEETNKTLNNPVFDNIRKQEVQAPKYELYQDEYMMKETSTSGELIDVRYKYEKQENQYILEDKNHEYHEVYESELERV